MLGQELGNALTGICQRGHRFARDVQAGFALLAGRAQREGRPAGGFGLNRYQQRGIAIADIPARALGVLRKGRLAKSVTFGERTIFGKSPARAPPVVRNPCPDGEIQRGAIGTRLSARNNREV